MYEDPRVRKLNPTLCVSETWGISENLPKNILKAKNTFKRTSYCQTIRDKELSWVCQLFPRASLITLPKKNSLSCLLKSSIPRYSIFRPESPIIKGIFHLFGSWCAWWYCFSVLMATGHEEKTFYYRGIQFQTSPCQLTTVQGTYQFVLCKQKKVQDTIKRITTVTRRIERAFRDRVNFRRYNIKPAFESCTRDDHL